ncbi:TIGR04438 family Trp-rich protein [Pseudorhodoferax sp.]|uniref:TIGR04438 family Trp-rich protein n=1 Tax=Pseudorhodoferax sp. TaxID=1993553 RepID=UPI002DD65494|nr:TIGR04438 family Trp-rich protein [Pseudorhodoferax sp.]
MVALGCLFSLLKLADVGPMAHWDWWIVLLPFAAAAAWWMFADAVGITQKQAMERHDRHTEERRAHHLKSMGLDIFDKKSKGRRPPR